MKILADPVERLLYITLAVVFIGNVLAVGFLIFLVAQSSQQVTLLQQRSKTANAHNAQIVNEIQAESQKQTAYIQCIADFFARPDRASLTLADLNSCTIASGGNPPVSLMPPMTPSRLGASSPPAKAVTPAPTPAKTTTASAPAPRQTGVLQRILNVLKSL